MFFNKSGNPNMFAVDGFTTKENINEIVAFEQLFTDIDNELHSIVRESFVATYYGIIDDCPNIVREGFGDFVNKAVDFFKKLCKSFITFIKNIFTLLESYVTDFKKFTEKHKDNAANIKPFNVSIYKYSIKSDPVDKCGIESIINGYNKDIPKLKEMSLADLQAIIAKENSKEYFSGLRGKMCGKSFISRDKYHDELFKHFREGKNSTTQMEIDSSKISTMISEYKDFDSLVKSTKEEYSDVEGVFDDIIDFFKSMPSFKYEGSDHKTVDIHKIEHGEKTVGISKVGSEDWELNYYKRVTAYYNFRFKQAKEISYIYSKAYTMKVSALKEALSEYRGVIRKSLNPFSDKKDGGEK